MQWTDRIGRRVKLRDLHILLAVAQSGSMAQAARRLAISHPVVSKTVSDLEHALGIRLFDRTAQGTELTAYGRAMLGCSTAVFDELRRGIQQIAFLSDPTIGEVRVGGAPPYIDGLIPGVVAQLARRYPKIEFHVTEADAVTLCGMLRERKLDLVVGRASSALIGQDLTTDILFEEALLVVAGHKSPWARRKKIELQELAGEPWLMPELDNIAMALIAGGFRSVGYPPPKPQVVSNSMALRMRLVETSQFVAILPASTLRFAAKRLNVKILPVRLPMKAPPAEIITLKDRTPNPIAKLFIDELRALAKAPAAKTAVAHGL